jgi:hypothetical protein
VLLNMSRYGAERIVTAGAVAVSAGESVPP